MHHFKRRGFTLIEVLVATFILLIGICSMLALFVFTMNSAQLGWDRTLATSHAEQVLEAMQATNTLSEIVSTDWEQWYRQQKLDSLPKEELHVTYADPKSDPLSIRVQVQWNRKRMSNTVIETQMTK